MANVESRKTLLLWKADAASRDGGRGKMEDVKAEMC